MLDIAAPHVVLRGESGDAARVVLHGDGMTERRVGVAISVSAPDVAIADLTAGFVGYHGIQIRGERGASRAVLHNVHVLDTGQQLVKGSVASGRVHADNGLVACSLFEYTDHAPSSYTNGVDILAGRGWTVRDNRFERIRGPASGRWAAGPAVLFWANSQDTVVERNVIVDSFRGIALGLGPGGSDLARDGERVIDHQGGRIRNNTVVNLHAWADEGIEANSAPGVSIENNTVLTEGSVNWSISLRFPATGATVRNNLTSLPIVLRNGGRAELRRERGRRPLRLVRQRARGGPPPEPRPPRGPASRGVRVRSDRPGSGPMTAARLPVVSFIIPVRDDARRLKACLASIERTDYPRGLVEIVVVDNGSVDDSARVAREAGAIVLSMTKGRVAALRNTGAAAAQGRVLAFVDADHEIGPRLGARRRFRTRRLVGGRRGVAGLASAWRELGAATLRRPAVGPLEREDALWLGSGNLAVKWEAFQSIGGFDASLETCEDVDFCQRLQVAGHRLVAEPDMRSVHMGDPSSLRAVFFGELWRGRDNLQVTLRGPWTFRHLRSTAVPLIDIAALAVGVIALLLGVPWLAMFAGAGHGHAGGCQSLVHGRRDPAPSLLHAVQALTVAFTYDTGRALALLARAGHRSRRSAEH